MTTAVTSPDVVIDLRPSALAAVFYAASLMMAAALVVTVVGMDGDVPFTVFFLVFLAGIVLPRLPGRHRRRQHRHRAQPGAGPRRRAGVGSARRIQLLLTDGSTVPLIATETPPLPGLGQRMEQQAEQLRAWMTGTPTPYR